MERNPKRSGAGGRELKIARQNADDGDLLAVQPERGADYIEIRAEFAAPESVAEDDDVRAIRLGFVLEKVVAQRRLDPEGGEEIRSDLGSLGQLGLAMEFEVEAISIIAGEGLKTLSGMLPVQKIGVRRLGRIDVWILLAGFAEKEQFGGAMIGERTK